MPEVYRVQHKYQCTGPYNTEPDQEFFSKKKYKRWVAFREELAINHGKDSFHPGWFKDGIDALIEVHDNSHEFISGFRTLEHLYIWFEGLEEELRQLDFEIVVYNVDEDDIIDGYSKRQIAFRNHGFFSIRSMPIELNQVNKNIPVKLFGRQTKSWSDAMVE
jgi:hypothetical protein